MIEIKRNGKVFYTLEDICKGSKLSRQLMDHHYIILKFTTVEPVYFEIGDSVEIPDFGYFELTSAYFPKQGEDGGYDYELQLDAYYMAWKNKICKYRPQYGANETSFNLTTSVSVHLNVVLSNLKALGYKYNGKDYSVDFTTYNKNTFDVEKRFLVSYDSISILDAITTIAETLECEWWIDGSIIYLGTCEMVGQVTFEQGVNVKSMSYSESKATYITRLYAFGSDRNIPKGYFTGVDVDVTTDGIATDYLMLPAQGVDADGFVSKNGYLENVNVVKNTAQAIEGVVKFDDEYPKVECVVSGIKTYDSTVSNDDGTTTTQTFWQVTSNDSFTTKFEKGWIKDGLTLMIKFTSGSLLGMEFEVSYKIIDSRNYFEIVANEEYGRSLPDKYLCPKRGDKFFLYNWNANKITDTNLIQESQSSLLLRAKTYYKKSMISNANFDCEMDAADFYNNGTYDYHPLGDQVKLINPMFADIDAEGKHYRNSRIIGMEINLDIPYDAPTYIVGEKAAYSKLGQLEDKVDSITVNGIQIGATGSGGGVYVIGLNDSTPATDSNVYSARRVRHDFLSKINDDTAQGTITFNKVQRFMDGLVLGDKTHYVDGKGNAVLKDVALDRIHDPKSTPAERVIIGAQGFDLYMGDDNKAHLYLDYLTVRNKAFFSQLEIRKVSYSGGTLLLSNAGSTIVKVVYIFDESGEKVIAYKCYAAADDGTTATFNYWKVGMMALCQTFNIKAGIYDNVSNRYYWRLCVGVGQETLEDGKLYDWVILSNIKEFSGGDAILPSYALRILADENRNYLSWGGVLVAVNNKEANTSLASLLMKQDGITQDEGNTPIADRKFWGYEEIDVGEPDAPAVGDVIVNVGDQVKWNSRGNVIKLTTSTEDDQSGTAPAMTMYRGIGAPRVTKAGKINVWQWEIVTALISPAAVTFNASFFKLFTDDPDKSYDPWAKTLEQATEQAKSYTNSQLKITNDNIEAFTQRIQFNADGTIANISKSGLITTDNMSTQFSKLVDTDGNILAVASIKTSIITKDGVEGTTNISQVDINADKINISAEHKLTLSSSEYLNIESGNFKLTDDIIEINAKNFSIDKDGNCSMTGEVHALSGKIGEFEIQGNGLYNGSTADDAYINLYNDRTKVRAAIGGNTVSSATGLIVPAFFESSQSNYNGGVNVGMMVSAQNATYNRAIVAHGNVIVHDGYTANVRYSGLGLSTNDTAYQNQMKIRENNIWVVNAIASNVNVGLPMYNEVKDAFGIAEGSSFAIIFRVISDYNSGSFQIKGRSLSDSNYNDDRFPNIIYHDGQHLDYINMEMGDSAEFLLVYNPSDFNTKENYTMKYTARVINRQFE